MSDQAKGRRFLVADTCNHQGPQGKGDKGSLQYQLHGPTSITLKCAADGLPADDRDDLIEAAKGGIEAAIASDLPFSGIFFANLADAGEDQPSDAEDCAEALEQALEDGADVWLSKRGKLTVGVNKTGMSRKGGGTTSRRPKKTKKQSNAIAAFLKRK